MSFGRLGGEVRPGTFGKIQVGQQECPKSPLSETCNNCSGPISADPICPFVEIRSVALIIVIVIVIIMIMMIIVIIVIVTIIIITII